MKVRDCSVCGHIMNIESYNKNIGYFGKIDGIEYWECADCYPS